jgi:general secretion pathway protein A
MYRHFYGLQAQPFELSPNPRYLLLTPTHREALSMLEYGITAGKGVILLVGEAGTGKTSLLRKALSMRLVAAGATDADCIYINNPRLTRAEFFDQLAVSFGLDRSLAASKPQLLKALEDELLARRAAGRSVALIIDEAQSLRLSVLEELRLLVNIEANEAKLLPLVLAGQPELADRLNQHELRQFKQRIVLRCSLRALDVNETATYMFGRIRLAGGDAAQIFTRDAVAAVFAASKGIPRTISVIADNALLAGFALQQRPIGAAVIEEVCRDLDIQFVSTGVPFPGVRTDSSSNAVPAASEAGERSETSASTSLADFVRWSRNTG